GVEDAIAVARELSRRRCDLIEVAAGQTIPRVGPDYRRLYLVPFADRIRNEAGVLTMVGGNVASRDDANTILAAGRADLCLVDPGGVPRGRVRSFVPAAPGPDPARGDRTPPGALRALVRGDGGGSNGRPVRRGPTRHRCGARGARGGRGRPIDTLVRRRGRG